MREKSLTIDYTRQRRIIDPKHLQIPITIVGVGGIGSWAALALAKMGCRLVTLYDHDIIAWHNVPSQFLPVYMPMMAEGGLAREVVPVDAEDEADQGIYKVDGLSDLLYTLCGVQFEVVAERYEGQPVSGVLISAVDSMEARREIWRANRDNVGLLWLVDARIGGQTLVVYTVDMTHQEAMEAYEASLYSDEEAEQLPCTARAVVYVGLMVGGVIARVVRGIALRQQMPFYTAFDAENLEIVKSGAAEFLRVERRKGRG